MVGGGNAPSAPAIALHGARIVIGVGLLGELGAAVKTTTALRGRRIAIISDDVVAPLYADRLVAAWQVRDTPAPMVFTLPNGESNKTREEWGRLTDEMIAAGFGRDCAVVALGGGVVGDLAGFVAATFMRGVPLVQVPTTLLAMIDAAIGGKTGVDTRAGKNLVGAFHHPSLVLVDPRALRTLPAMHLRNGLAEAIKHGIVADAAAFAWTAAHIADIVRDGGPDDDVALQLVRQNIELKASIVARDERESGLRKVLNFGHTIAHAIETESRYTLLHGECVAIGMVVESRIAARIGVAERGLAGDIASVLRDAALPTALPEGMRPLSVVAATKSDKKARAGTVEYALPARLGEMAGADRGYAIPVSDELVLECLTTE